MKMCLLSTSLTLLWNEIDYCTKKEQLSRTWLGDSLEYCFLLFQIRETNYEKGPDGVFFFFVSFSNSLNMKNISSYSYVRLIKPLG